MQGNDSVPICFLSPASQADAVSDPSAIATSFIRLATLLSVAFARNRNLICQGDDSLQKKFRPGSSYSDKSPVGRLNRDERNKVIDS